MAADSGGSSRPDAADNSPMRDTGGRSGGDSGSDAASLVRLGAPVSVARTTSPDAPAVEVGGRLSRVVSSRRPADIIDGARDCGDGVYTRARTVSRTIRNDESADPGRWTSPPAGRVGAKAARLGRASWRAPKKAHATAAASPKNVPRRINERDPEAAGSGVGWGMSPPGTIVVTPSGAVCKKQARAATRRLFLFPLFPFFPCLPAWRWWRRRRCPGRRLAAPANPRRRRTAAPPAAP